ncbi:pentatricopeptide repeat-containing protein [Tanacetum coccineum]
MQACTIDRIMFSQLLDMLVAKVKDNIWVLFICIPGLDIDSGGLKFIESDADVHALYDLAEKSNIQKKEHDKRKKHAYNMSVKELVAWAEEEARSYYLRSPPLKSRPIRNDMKVRVLFTDMYCAEDEGFKITPPLNDDEVGKEDLLVWCSNLENDCVNDAAKILEGMSEGKNNASKSVEFTQGVQGVADGINGIIYDGIDAANIDIDEQFKVNGAEVPDEFPREAGDEGRSAQDDHTKLMLTALLRKLKGNGKGITYPFAIVEDSKERSNKEKIVAKCGQRKEIIKDPSNGKQRAFKKYPSNNAKKTTCDVTIQDHYGYLRSYVKALADSNEGSTIKVGVTINPNEKTYFDRFYVCFKALKDGWKMGCRRIIVLDGLAWVVVSVENKDNWSWFLELIAEDLEVPNGNGLTLMSDQHKGLIEAVKDVMPLSEHRQCARHIYDGFRNQFSGVEFKELFWVTSISTYPQRFNKIIEKIKTANPREHQHLLLKGPKTWSRAFFTDGRCCEVVENGFIKCFNYVLVWHVIPCGDNQFEVRRGSDAFKNKMVEDYVPECFKKDRHNKKGCKKEPIPAVPKEKKKAGRPKKTPNTKTLENDNDVPAFVDNDIDKFEMGASNTRVVFNDGRVEKKGGRLMPAQRLGRMGIWLDMKGATSDPIEDTKAFQSSLLAFKQPSNFLGTHQSQILRLERDEELDDDMIQLGYCLYDDSMIDIGFMFVVQLWARGWE